MATFFFNFNGSIPIEGVEISQNISTYFFVFPEKMKIFQLNLVVLIYKIFPDINHINPNIRNICYTGPPCYYTILITVCQGFCGSSGWLFYY